MIAALKDLGLTFLVGALTLVGVEAILWYLFDRAVTGFFRGRLGLFGAQASSGESADLAVWVFVVSAFVLGIFVEDLSYAWRDPGDLPYPASGVFQDSRKARLAVLIRPDSSPLPLGRELSERRAFSRMIPSASAIAMESRLARGAKLTAADSGSDVLFARLYYHAKNSAYKETEYFSELQQIQSRVDFTRSFFIVACILSLAISVTMALGVVWRIARHFFARQLGPTEAVGPVRRSLMALGHRTSRRTMSAWAQRAGGILLTLGPMCVASGFAFSFESHEFNKRVFGYYSTSLVNADGSEKAVPGDTSRASLTARPAPPPPAAGTPPPPRASH